MKLLVVAFNQESNLVGAFSVLSQTSIFAKVHLKLYDDPLELPDVAGHDAGAQLQCDGCGPLKVTGDWRLLPSLLCPLRLLQPHRYTIHQPRQHHASSNTATLSLQQQFTAY